MNEQSERDYVRFGAILDLMVTLREQHKARHPECVSESCPGGEALRMIADGIRTDRLHMAKMGMTAIGKLARERRRVIQLQAALDQKTVALADAQAMVAKMDMDLMQMGARLAEAEGEITELTESGNA